MSSLRIPPGMPSPVRAPASVPAPAPVGGHRAGAPARLAEDHGAWAMPGFVDLPFVPPAQPQDTPRDPAWQMLASLAPQSGSVWLQRPAHYLRTLRQAKDAAADEAARGSAAAAAVLQVLEKETAMLTLCDMLRSALHRG